MKYKNKITGEIVEPKTFTERYICSNNSNYEPVSKNRVVEPVEEVVEEIIEPTEEISVEEPVEEVVEVTVSEKKKNRK